MGVNLVEFKQKAYKMFTGKLEASPFPPEQIAKGKVFFKEWCKSWVYPGERQAGDGDQEIDMRLLIRRLPLWTATLRAYFSATTVACIGPGGLRSKEEMAPGL